jgi:uncharacterized protein YndB with AHSA1/START domain
MIVTNVAKDPQRARMSITSEFDAPVDRAWRLWADPRQLERWWGPPGYPATFVEHDLRPGGTVTYFMSGPEGERFHGFWRIVDATAPERLTFDDGFADDDGNHNEELPVTRVDVALTARTEGGTRMTIDSQFASPAAMEQLMAMGMEEGFLAALGQIEALLLEDSRTG